MPLIRSTVVPENYEPLSDEAFNKWSEYVAGIKPKNTPKKGGAGWEEEQNELLDQVNEMLATNAKR